jgi:hypothetical protein
VGDASFPLNKLRGVLAPVVNQLVLDEGLNDATVRFVQQAPDLCHRKFLVRKQITNSELSLLFGRELRGIFRHDERPLGHLERFLSHDVLL